MEPARSRRLKVAVLVVLGAIAFYGVAVGLIAPPIARKMIVERLGEQLGRTVAMDDLRINPYTLDASARGFRIMEADRTTPFVSFDTLDIEGSATSLYRFAPIADSITLYGLKVTLVRDGQAHYNISDVLERLAAGPAEPKAKDEKPTSFSVSNVRLVNARIDFDDRPMGKKHQVTDINVAVPFISNLPRHLKEFVQPAFAANVNGSPLKLTGETLPFEDSLRTHIAIDLDALDLRRYVEYSPVPLPVKIESGKLHATLSVRFTQSGKKDATVDVAGKLAVTELGIANLDGTSLARLGALETDIASFDPLGGMARVTSVEVKDVNGLSGAAVLPLIAVKNVDVDLKKKLARVESVVANGGAVSLKRNRDGAIELPTIAMPPPSGAPWTIAVARLAVGDLQLALLDQAVKPEVMHRVKVARLEATELTTADGLKGALAANLGLDQGGTLEVATTFTLEPLLVNAKLDARRVDMARLRPYAMYFPAVAMKSGAASAKGTLVLRGKGDALQVSYNGGAEISNLVTVDTVNREDLLNWKSVRSNGIEFSWAPRTPLTLNVAEIVVDKVYSRLVLNADGKLNVQALRTGVREEPAGAEPLPRNVRIDRITFVDSRLNFTDLFIKPNYSADVGELQGSITKLSSDPNARGVVDLKGRYDRAAPVTIAGTVNPLSGNLFVDIAAKGQGIELPKLTAYSQRYAGYGITEGKLTLDVKYHIENGKLEGRNKVLIERLTFGDKVESPDATTLPVLFAVNLLKDANGEIALELPITGSLADPQFQVGALITQVLGNLLKKAVTAPFSLLAAAFGGGAGSASGNGSTNAGSAGRPSSGGNDLGYVEFEPGASEIAASGTAKLDTLARALLQRPGLTLTMAPRLDRDKDTQALREAVFQRKLLAAKGGNAKSIEDAEYPAIVRKVYAAEKYPRPAPVKGVVYEPSVAAMEAQMLETLAVGEEDLRALSTKRAEQVRSYLVKTGQLPENRVVVATAPIDVEGTKARMSRVDFSLQ